MPDFGIMRGFGEKLFSDKLVAGQLPTQLGLIGSENFGFDPDAQAFFDRVTAAGGTLSATEKLAVNQLVIDMKAYGIWSAMKAVYPMVGASAAACAQNLKSSSFTGTFSSGWTFASTGVTPNGTSAYFNTTVKVSVNLALNSNSFSFYSRTEKNALEPDMGASVQDGTTNELNVYTRLNNVIFFRNNSSGTSSAASNTSSLGLFINNRISSTETRNRVRNILVVQNSQSNTANSSNIYISAVGDDVGTLRYSSRNIAFAHIGDGLTDTQASNLYTAVQAFQTTLSREV